jgi:hypothetical protein
MEAVFSNYINVRLAYGYSFEQAVNLFLNDPVFTDQDKQAECVNTARNQIILNNNNAANLNANNAANLNN